MGVYFPNTIFHIILPMIEDAVVIVVEVAVDVVCEAGG